MNISVAITDERSALVDVLGNLGEREWSTASLCDRWTIRGVVGHLLTAQVATRGEVMRSAVRLRNVNEAFATIGRQIGRKPIPELMGLLRQFVATRQRTWAPGRQAALSDVIIHSQDIYVPLGIDRTSPIERVTATLDFLADWRSAPLFSTPFRRVGLALEATDSAWTHGSGLAVRGTGMDLAMALAGRSERIDRLSGDGVNLLSARLT